jgi:hypothetical protein
VAGHDRKICPDFAPDFAQAKRIPFDPFRLLTTTAAPSQGQHRTRRLDTDHSVAAFGQLARRSG